MILTKQAAINKAITKARIVYVRVAGTEFWAKVTKAEARALNEHMFGLLDESWIDREDCGDLYLEGMK